MERSKLNKALTWAGYVAAGAVGGFVVYALERPRSDATPPASVQGLVSTPAMAKSEVQATTVYVTRSGAKYHRSTCQHARSARELDLETARQRGLEPCKVCRPPTR